MEKRGMNAVLKFLRWPYLLIALFFGALLVLGSSDTARASHLACGTTYYYRARSTDASSNTATSTEKSFTTSACPAGSSGSGSGGSSGSGGTVGSGSTGGATTTGTTTTGNATATTSGTSTATGSTTTGTTKTTAKKTTTAATAAKTAATPKPGEVSETSSSAETTTQLEATPAATVTLAIALPQSIAEYRIFFSGMAPFKFCSGRQTPAQNGCIDPNVLRPLSPPPPLPPACQDGSFDLRAEHLRGPKFLAALIERVVPEIPCDGPAEDQADQADDGDAQYCAGYQESSLITKLFVANPCLEIDEIGQDRLDCYADLAAGTPCILGEGDDTTPSPDGAGEDIALEDGGGELVCPPPASPVGDACVAQDPDIPIDDGGGEIGPDDVCLPSGTSLLTKIRFLDVESCSFFEDDSGDGGGGCPTGFSYEGVSERCIKTDDDGDEDITCEDGRVVRFEADCHEGPPPPPDCGIPTGFRQPLRASHSLAIIDPFHRHGSDPEVHIRAGESVTIGAELTQQEAQALGTYASAYGAYSGYLRNVDNHPEGTLIVPTFGGYSAGHASLAQDDLSNFLSSVAITEPTRVTYTGVQPSSGGFCPTRDSIGQSISIIVEANPDLFSSLVAAPSDIAAGGVSELNWFVHDGQVNVREIQLDSGTGFKVVTSFGREIVQPQQTTTYTLRIITNPNSQVIDRQATVTVRADQTRCGDGTTWVATSTFPAGCPPSPPGCASLTTSLIAPSHAHPLDPTARVIAGEPITIASHYSGQENSPALFEGYVRYAPAEPNLYKVMAYRSAPDDGDHRFTVTDDGADFLAPGTKITEPTLVQYHAVAEISCLSALWPTTITVLVVPPAQGEPAATFTAEPDVIVEGGESTLTWSTTNATTIKLNGEPVGASGTQAVSPTETTDYTLVATGPGGEAIRTVTVTVTESVGACVIRNPVFGLGEIRANPAERGPHDSPLTVILSAAGTLEDPGRLDWWITTDGTDPALRAQERRGSPDARGNEITLTLLAPGARVRAHLIATDPCNLEQSRSFDQDYQALELQPQPPSVTLTGTPAEVAVGGSFTLSWTSTDATRITLSVAPLNVGCNGHGLSLDPVASGSVTLPFPSSGTDRCSYLAVAEGSGGSTRSQTVTVGTAAQPPVGGPPGQAPPTELVLRITPDGGANLNEPVSVTLDAQVPPERRTELVILYTTDPAVSDRNLEQGAGVERYRAPITLRATTELRAIAFLGSQQSAIASALFRFRQQECTPAVLCRLQGNFKIEITPNPEDTVFDGPTVFELKPIPPTHAIASLHLERGSAVPSRSSARIAATVTISERGVYTFKAFGSESDPLTVFIDIAAPPADPGAPTVAVSPAPGSFSQPVTVGLTASGGSAPVTISYTTSGEDPRTAGTTYQGPITLTGSTFLKYVATDSTGKTSAVGQAFYAIEPAPAGQGPGAPAGPPGSTLLTWQPVAAATSAGAAAAVSYEVSCNGKLVGTVDQPIVRAPAPEEPCTYTVAVKSGDQVVESIAQVTPVALAARPAAPAAKAKAAPTTPIAKAVAVVETTVAPAVATTATVAAVAAATGAASAPVAAAASGLLYQILAHGFGVVALLGWRRKGPFSEVLDRTTGLPVGGATVTMLEATSTRATAVATTDTLGRFSMLVDQPGRYLVRVSHPRYATWHSRELTIGKPQEALDLPTITLQAGQVSTGLSRPEAYSQLILSGLNAARLPLLIAGTLILLATSVEAAGTLRLTPDRSASLALYVALWVSEAWVRTKPRPYGVVVDAATGEPVTRAIVRLLDGATGRLLRTVVTGSQGRFQFLAPKGSGSLVVVHPGYAPYRQDHLMLSDRVSFVNETVRLRPLTEGAGPITPPPPPIAPAPSPVRPIVPPQLPRHGPPPASLADSGPPPPSP